MCREMERDKKYMVVLDLDFTLWPYYAENVDREKTPAERYSCRDNVPSFFDGVENALNGLRQNTNVVTAIASCSPDKTMCRSILRRRGFEWIMKYSEIYPGSKADHVRNLSRRSGIPLSATVLFDDCALFRSQAESVGAFTVAIDRSIGFTTTVLRKGLQGLKDRERSSNLMRAFLDGANESSSKSEILMTTTTTTTTERLRQSEEGTCPLCFKRFPLGALPTHAATCEGKKNTPRCSSKKRDRDGGIVVASIFCKKRGQIARTKKKSSSLLPCPVCGRHFHHALLTDHAATCGESAQKKLHTKKGFTTTKCVGTAGERAIEIAKSLASASTSSNNSSTSSVIPGAFRKLMGKKMRTAPAHPDLPGCHVFCNFLSKEEESTLISEIDACEPPWLFSSWNGSCMTKTWGVEVDVVARTVGKAKRPIPQFMQSLIQRMCSGDYLPLAGFLPNEANANSYDVSRRHWLRAHVDDRQLSGELLANLSLGADCDMLYKHEVSGRQVTVRLPRRALQVVSKESRYDWTHEIRKDEIYGSRRVSVTFRGNGVVKGNKRGPAVGKPKHAKYTL